MTKMTETKTKIVRLGVAIAHGYAHHQRNPWRIRKGQCEVGTPAFTKNGQPRLVKGEIKLVWRTIEQREAEATWSSTGWILDKP